MKKIFFFHSLIFLFLIFSFSVKSVIFTSNCINSLVSNISSNGYVGTSPITLIDCNSGSPYLSSTIPNVINITFNDYIELKDFGFYGSINGEEELPTNFSLEYWNGLNWIVFLNVSNMNTYTGAVCQGGDTVTWIFTNSNFSINMSNIFLNKIRITTIPNPSLACADTPRSKIYQFLISNYTSYENRECSFQETFSTNFSYPINTYCTTNTTIGFDNNWSCTLNNPMHVQVSLYNDSANKLNILAGDNPNPIGVGSYFWLEKENICFNSDDNFYFDCSMLDNSNNNLDIIFLDANNNDLFRLSNVDGLCSFPDFAYLEFNHADYPLMKDAKKFIFEFHGVEDSIVRLDNVLIRNNFTSEEETPGFNTTNYMPNCTLTLSNIPCYNNTIFNFTPSLYCVDAENDTIYYSVVGDYQTKEILKPLYLYKLSGTLQKQYNFLSNDYYFINIKPNTTYCKPNKDIIDHYLNLNGITLDLTTFNHNSLKLMGYKCGDVLSSDTFLRALGWQLNKQVQNGFIDLKIFIENNTDSKDKLLKIYMSDNENNIYTGYNVLRNSTTDYYIFYKWQPSGLVYLGEFPAFKNIEFGIQNSIQKLQNFDYTKIYYELNGVETILFSNNISISSNATSYDSIKIFPENTVYSNMTFYISELVLTDSNYILNWSTVLDSIYYNSYGGKNLVIYYTDSAHKDLGIYNISSNYLYISKCTETTIPIETNFPTYNQMARDISSVSYTVCNFFNSMFWSLNSSVKKPNMCSLGNWLIFMISVILGCLVAGIVLILIQKIDYFYSIFTIGQIIFFWLLSPFTTYIFIQKFITILLFSSGMVILIRLIFFSNVIASND